MSFVLDPDEHVCPDCSETVVTSEGPITYKMDDGDEYRRHALNAFPQGHDDGDIVVIPKEYRRKS